jgi:hypothetical protein
MEMIMRTRSRREQSTLFTVGATDFEPLEEAVHGPALAPFVRTRGNRKIADINERKLGPLSCIGEGLRLPSASGSSWVVRDSQQLSARVAETGCVWCTLIVTSAAVGVRGILMMSDGNARKNSDRVILIQRLPKSTLIYRLGMVLGA